MNRAREETEKPRQAALLVRVATAIEVLLHIPLRIDNLTKLRIGPNLRSDGKRITHLVLGRHETKNKADLEWPIEPDRARFLGRYIRDFRPQLVSEASEWLFSAGHIGPGPLSTPRLAGAIKDIIAEEVGAIMNPHLFRAFTARLILERSPGALEDVRLLLGDKSLVTVLAYYAALEPARAAARYDDLLRDVRRGGGLVKPLKGRGARS